MTVLGIQIVWLAMRVTAFTLCAAALAWWSARRAARSAVIVVAAAMAIVLALSAGALFPAPDFGGWSPFTTARDIRDANWPTEIAANDEPHVGGFTISTIWKTLGELSHPTPQPTSWQNGSAFVAIVYGLGMAVAAWRLTSAWLAVQTLRRRSRPIADANVLGLVDLLRGRLACARPVELLECDEPGLAATVGSWRPVIFLPPEWRQWTESETQAVLAHELAHVRHGDYLSGFLTRVCQALHFYHPLVYWLSNQLRWQQELAADHLAASALAESSQYVKSLASLALRSPARMSAAAMPWSAISGGALLRRIEMLRETRKSRPLNGRLRGLLVGTLAGVGLLLASLGGSTPPETAVGQAESFEIGYLPSYAKGFAAFRPALLMAQPGMDGVKAQIVEGVQWLREKGFTVPDALRPENIEQFVTETGITSKGTGEPNSRSLIFGSSATYIRLKRDFDWPAFFKTLAKEVAAATNASGGFEIKEYREDGVTIYDAGVFPFFGPQPLLFTMPDRRSVVFCSLSRGDRGPGPAPDVQYLRHLIRNVAQARQRDWGSFDKVARAPIAAVLDNHDQHYSKTFAKDASAEMLATLANIRFATIGIEVGDGQPVRLILDTKSEAAAAGVEKHLSGVFQTELSDAEKSKPENKHDEVMRTLFGELHQSRKLNRQGARLEWLGYSSVRFPDLLSPNEEKRSIPEQNRPER